MKRRQNPPSEGRSIRTLKIGEAMRHALADALARGVVRDDLLARHIISVSEVRVSPDLRQATAYVMPLGANAAQQTEVLHALNRHAPLFRAEIARRVNSRYAAQIHFAQDESYAEGSKIDSLLRAPEVLRDLETGPEPDDAA